MQALARSSRCCAVVIGLAVACVTAASAAATALPNPCTLLTKVHPEDTFKHGATPAVTHQKLLKYGTGRYLSMTCSELVGTQSVNLNLSAAPAGGFGGVANTKVTHPKGLGAGDTLVTGTALGGNHGPVDFVLFHRGSLYVDLSANGATPALLTTFARQVYKALP